MNVILCHVSHINSCRNLIIPLHRGGMSLEDLADPQKIIALSWVSEAELRA